MSKLVQLGLNLIGLDLSKIEFFYKFCSMELKILKPCDLD